MKKVREAAGLLLLCVAFVLTGCAQKLVNDAGSRRTTASHGAVTEETEGKKDGEFTCSMSEDDVLTVRGTGRLSEEDLYDAISRTCPRVFGKPNVWDRALLLYIPKKADPAGES